LALDDACQQETCGWGAAETLQEVSAYFEREFHFRLSTTKITSWQVPRRNENWTLAELLQQLLQTVDREDADIVIGVTGRAIDSPNLGWSYFQEGYVMVRWCDDANLRRRVFGHEIAHLFGATHVEDSDSLMDRFSRGQNLTGFNREIVRLHRDRDFQGIRFPLSSPNLARAADLYREIARYNERLAPTISADTRDPRLGIWLRGGEPTPAQSAKICKAFARLEDVYICSALIRIEMKEFVAAISECRLALRINPAQAEAYNLMGIALRRSGRIDEAIESYRSALAIDPLVQGIHYNLGIAFMKKGNTAAAKNAYLKALEANPRMSEAWNNLGYIHLETGEVAKAIDHFQTAIRHHRHYPLAQANLAEAYLRNGDREGARAQAQQALALDERAPEPHHILGRIHSDLGEWAEAEKEYREAVSLDPAYFKGYYNLGNLYLKKKAAAQAAECFEKTLSLNPQFVEAYVGLGDAHLLLPDIDRAEQAFQKALEMGQRNTELFLNLSFIRIQKRDFASALTLARNALAIDPGLALAHYNEGIALRLSGRSQEAEGAFIRATQADAKLKAAWSALGDLYCQNDQLDKALASYRSAVALDPDDGVMHNNLAVVHFLRKEYAQALEQVQEAERLRFAVSPDFKQELQKALKAGERE